MIGPNIHLQGEVIIGHKEQALEEATKYRAGLIMWTDGSKLDQGNTGAAVCWKDKSVFFGKNKEVLDAELSAILDVLKFATKETRNAKDIPITIFCDSQKALIAIQHAPSQRENRYLRGLIYDKARELQEVDTL